MKISEAYSKDRIHITSENFKPIFYVPYLGIATVHFPFQLSLLNKVIVFENKFPLVFTKELRNRFIVAKVISERTGSRELKTIVLLGDYPTLEKAFKQSYLQGFGRVIQDDNYFSKTPLINELTHWDNGILSDSKVSVTVELNPDRNLKWDDFTLSTTTETIKGNPILRMVGDKHHERY